MQISRQVKELKPRKLQPPGKPDSLILQPSQNSQFGEKNLPADEAS